MMRISNILQVTLLVATSIWGVVSQPTQAVQLADGTVYFVQPPRLLEATTTQRSVNVWGATYYFTLSLPEKAGEPLQRITITQQEGGGSINYYLKSTQAFEGTRRHRGARIALRAVTMNASPPTVEVIFNPPVPPGKTVTIGLRPVRNPSLKGMYLFGVTAFPPGEKAHGQFQGFGRFNFEGRG